MNLTRDIISGLLLYTLAGLVWADDQMPRNALYEQKCASCHTLPDPHNLTAPQWVEQLESMAPMARLEEEEKQRLLAFLQANAGQPGEVLAKETSAYNSNCAGCHADPASVPKMSETGSELERALIDHLEDDFSKVLTKTDAHEIAEFLLIARKAK